MILRAILINFMLTLSALGVQGHPISDTDTLQMPEKILNLPSERFEEGDRAGTWGLPTLIAMRYGLTVNNESDDRYDEEASRQAAMRYLTDLYAEFNDWELVYYAYLYSPAYVKNLQLRKLSIPQPKPEIKRPAKPKNTDQTQTPKKAKEAKFITYTVKSGDTLSGIAKKYHVSVADLKKWNQLKNDLIRINQKIKIYQ